MTTTPTDEEKARPTVHLRNQDYTLSLQNHRRGERWFIDTTDELAEVGAAVLQALDPATRARVLEPYLEDLESELRIWKAVAQKDDKMLRAELTEAQGTVELYSANLRILAAEMRGIIGLAKAENYVQLHVGDDLGDMVILIQKSEGKTPADVAAETKAELTVARAEVERLRAVARQGWESARLLAICPPTFGAPATEKAADEALAGLKEPEPKEPTT